MAPSALNASTLNPRTWVALGCAGLLLAFAPLPITWQVGLLAVLLALHIAGRTLVPWLRLVLAGLAPVAAMAFIIQLVSRGGETVWATWAPVPWMVFHVTAEGARAGVGLALQILAFGSACALLILPTGATGLRYALSTWGLPPRLIYLLVASLNAPAQLAHYSRLVQRAARARGMADGSKPARAWLGVRTASALFSLLLLDHEVRGATLAARGIDRGGPRVFWQDYADSRPQRYLRWALLPVACLLVLAAYTGVLQ